MAGSNDLIKLALFGGAAYLAYRQGWLSSLGIGPAGPGAMSFGLPPAATATPAPPPAPPAFQGANSLDAVFARLQAATKNAPGEGLSVDQWNYFLAQVDPSITPPDPMDVFPPAIPQFDRSQKISATQYWAVMAPYLRLKLGLSGLGIYGGLGALMRGAR